MTSERLIISVVAAALTLTAACGGGSKDKEATSTSSTESTTTTVAVTTTSAPIATIAPTTTVRVTTTARPVASAAQPFVTGYFKSAYGDMVFRQVNGQVRAVYDHKGGTIVGSVGADGVFRGWWTQTPTRQPDGDAGEVEFTFKSATHADGSWRYGTTGSVRNNWTLDRAQGEPPAALVARFNDEATFKSHP